MNLAATLNKICLNNAMLSCYKALRLHFEEHYYSRCFHVKLKKGALISLLLLIVRNSYGDDL